MIKEMKVGTYTRINDEVDESYNFNFYTDLSVAQKLKFVNSVTGLVVTDGNYNSVIRDLIFDFYIIDIFTDIDMKELKDSLNFLDDVEEFLYETNIIKIVKSNVNPMLIDELDVAVDKSIEYLTGIHPSPIADSIASLLYTIENKIGDVNLDDMMNMAKKFSGMTGEITPENIVNAYINSEHR